AEIARVRRPSNQGDHNSPEVFGRAARRTPGTRGRKGRVRSARFPTVSVCSASVRVRNAAFARAIRCHYYLICRPSPDPWEVRQQGQWFNVYSLISSAMVKLIRGVTFQRAPRGRYFMVTTYTGR